MTSAALDLGYLQSSVEELETYLLSGKLFWPLVSASPPGQPAYPRLTLGGLLLAQARSRARDLPPDDETRLITLESRIQRAKSKWWLAWTRKAVQEFHSRQRQWRNYLHDLTANPDAHQPYYPSEVRIRVMMQLLLTEIEPPEEVDQKALVQLDKVLQRIFQPGDFIWDEDLAHFFVRDVYWYLWGMPRPLDYDSGP